MSAVHDKAISILREVIGERADRLRGDRVSVLARAALEEAFQTESESRESYPPEIAREIAFHLSDWDIDAAFIVCLHLYPERFSADEIRAGIGQFLCHAPNHIRAACGLTGEYVWENWPESDPPDWELPGRSDDV
jgi:hypothetical protein